MFNESLRSRRSPSGMDRLKDVDIENLDKDSLDWHDRIDEEDRE